MTEQELEGLRYPTGRFVRGTKAETPERREACFRILESFPQRLRAEVEGLNDVELDTRYRPGGWTVRQVVHHLADSHGQALTRFKWALTEETPVIKAYAEALWAEQVDARILPVDASLAILAGVHARLVTVMRRMSPEEWQRGFIHPEQDRRIDLWEAVETYTWHSGHHLAHITRLKERGYDR
jgi:hypothetical protein